MPALLDEQVEGAERLDGASDDVALVLGVVGAARNAEGVVRSAERGDRIGEGVLLAGCDRDARALVDEPLRDGEADAAARTGDDRDLAPKSLHSARSSTVVGGVRSRACEPT